MASILYKGKQGEASATYLNPAIPTLDFSTVSLWGAYSVNRRIVSSYSGPLIDCRIISPDGTDTLTTINQSSGVLGVSAINRNSLLFVTKIYDQSGNNRHFNLSTRYVSNNSVGYSNSLIYSASKQDYLLFNTGFSFGGDLGWTVSSPYAVFVNGRMIVGIGTDGSGSGWGASMQNNIGNHAVVVSNTQYTLAASVSNGACSFSFSGSGQITMQTTGAEAVNNSIPSGSIRSSGIGIGLNILSDTSVGEVQKQSFMRDLIIYTSNLDASTRQTLRASLEY